MDRAASYDLAAEETASLTIWEKVRIGMLLDGMGTYLERKMWDPARLRALIYLRKDASGCPERNMLMARQVMPSFGYMES